MVFTNGKSLGGHMTTHHSTNKTPLECETCTRTFPTYLFCWQIYESNNYFFRIFYLFILPNYFKNMKIPLMKFSIFIRTWDWIIIIIEFENFFPIVVLITIKIYLGFFCKFQFRLCDFKIPRDLWFLVEWEFKLKLKFQQLLN